MKAFIAALSCLAAASAGHVYSAYPAGVYGAAYGVPRVAYNHFGYAGTPVTYTGAVAPVAAVNPYDYAGQVYPAAEPYLHVEVPAEEYKHVEVPAEPYVHEEVPAEEYVHEEIPAEPYVHEEVPAEPYVHQEVPAEPYIHLEPAQVAVAPVAVAPVVAHSYAAAPVAPVVAHKTYAAAPVVAHKTYAAAPVAAYNYGAVPVAYKGAYAYAGLPHGTLYRA